MAASPPGMDGALDLAPEGEGRWSAAGAAGQAGGDVVFGGRLLALMVLAESRSEPEKAVKTIHAGFVRPAVGPAPVTVVRQGVQSGRTVGFATIDVLQGGRVCARAQVMTSAGDDSVVSHSPPLPAVAPPDRSPPIPPGVLACPGAELRVVDGVDLWSADAPVGAPELFVWTRYPVPGRPPPALDPAASQAVLAWATTGFLVGTALRPHAGVGQGAAHVTLSTGVLTHSVTFHRRFDAGAWHLMAHRSVFAGGGRAYGVGDVFDEEGHLVASFAQDSLIRRRPPEAAGARL
ncbi:MAG TPA: acyl-CoA thioesterase domain-containing protein [Acidimicrobiales bacterium]|nr:acyl-CoA thioesterase domain-containing protein [Acidimicrobiales bacterium]